MSAARSLVIPESSKSASHVSTDTVNSSSSSLESSTHAPPVRPSQQPLTVEVPVPDRQQLRGRSTQAPPLVGGQAHQHDSGRHPSAVVVQLLKGANGQVPLASSGPVGRQNACSPPRATIADLVHRSSPSPESSVQAPPVDYSRPPPAAEASRSTATPASCQPAPPSKSFRRAMFVSAPDVMPAIGVMSPLRHARRDAPSRPASFEYVTGSPSRNRPVLESSTLERSYVPAPLRSFPYSRSSRKKRSFSDNHRGKTRRVTPPRRDNNEQMSESNRRRC